MPLCPRILNLNLCCHLATRQVNAVISLFGEEQGGYYGAGQDQSNKDKGPLNREMESLLRAP